MILVTYSDIFFQVVNSSVATISLHRGFHGRFVWYCHCSFLFFVQLAFFAVVSFKRAYASGPKIRSRAFTTYVCRSRRGIHIKSSLAQHVFKRSVSVCSFAVVFADAAFVYYSIIRKNPAELYWLSQFLVSVQSARSPFLRSAVWTLVGSDLIVLLFAVRLLLVCLFVCWW